MSAKIVEAVGTASTGRRLGAAIEEAMSAAYLEATAEGITDPDELRARKLAARERVKAEFAAGHAPKRED